MTVAFIGAGSGLGTLARDLGSRFTEAGGDSPVSSAIIDDIRERSAA